MRRFAVALVVASFAVPVSAAQAKMIVPCGDLAENGSGIYEIALRGRASAREVQVRLLNGQPSAWTGSAILRGMTTEDLPGGSAPGMAHPAGVVPQPPPVRDTQLADVRQPEFP